MVRAKGTSSARVIQVIETKAKKGFGTQGDPEREITQYWDLDGKHLATFDPEELLPSVNRDLDIEARELNAFMEKLKVLHSQEEKQPADM